MAATAVKRKSEKAPAKEKKDHKKAKVADAEDVKKSSKKSKSKPLPPPSPSPSESEAEEEVEEQEDAQMEDAGAEEGAWEDNAESDGEGSDLEMEQVDGKIVPVKPKTEEEVEKQRLARAEQKRLAQERKIAKPMGDIIQRSKRIWEQLRRKQSTPEERIKLIEELQSLVTGRIKELVFKHDASRVVQTALKYGNKDVKREIAEGLKGTYVEMAQSSYGKYLAVKVMHYGTEETRAMVSQEFCGHVRKLVKHREASFVLEDIYREFGTKAQRAQLLREFYGVEFSIFKPDAADTAATKKDKKGKKVDEAMEDGSLKPILDKNPEKRSVIMRNLIDILKQVVEKGSYFFTIVHRAMLEFITNVTPGHADAVEFIDLIKEHVGEIAFTKDGSQVVMRALALGTAKDRKVMIKALKPIADQLAAHEHGHLVLLTVFDVTDDTVLVSKTLFPELQTNLFDLAIHNFGRIPLLYPFTVRKRGLLPPTYVKLLEEMDELRKSTSKKDPEVRRKELRAQMSPVAVNGVKEFAPGLVHSAFGCSFITEAMLGADDDKCDKKAALEVLADLAAAGDPVPKEEKKKEEEAEKKGEDEMVVDEEPPHFASTAAGGRMLKTLVLGGHFNNKTKKIDVIQPPLHFHEILFPKIKEGISVWATGPASFVIVGLLECEGFTQRDELKKVLKTHEKAIKKAVKDGNKGSKVILDAISS